MGKKGTSLCRACDRSRRPSRRPPTDLIKLKISEWIKHRADARDIYLREYTVTGESTCGVQELLGPEGELHGDSLQRMRAASKIPGRHKGGRAEGRRLRRQEGISAARLGFCLRVPGSCYGKYHGTLAPIHLAAKAVSLPIRSDLRTRTGPNSADGTSGDMYEYNGSSDGR